MSDAAFSADLPRASRPTARARPGLVALYAGYVLLAGVVLAAPLAASFHDVVSSYPRGDAELADPGGLMLLEALRLAGRSTAPLSTSIGATGLLALFFGLLPLAALIAGLGREGRLSAPFLAARAVRSTGTLALLWGVTAVAQAILGVLVALLGGKIIDWTSPSKGPHETYAQAALGAAVLLAVLAAGVVRDLAIVSAVHDETRFYLSASRALRVFLRAFPAWIGRALLGLACLALAARLAMSLGAFPAFVIHQIGLLGAVFFRASWLAAAIRVLDQRSPYPPPAPSLPPAPVAPEPEAAPAPEPAVAAPEDAQGGEEAGTTGS